MASSYFPSFILRLSAPLSRCVFFLFYLFPHSTSSPSLTHSPFSWCRIFHLFPSFSYFPSSPLLLLAPPIPIFQPYSSPLLLSSHLSFIPPFPDAFSPLTHSPVPPFYLSCFPSSPLFPTLPQFIPHRPPLLSLMPVLPFLLYFLSLTLLPAFFLPPATHFLSLPQTSLPFPLSLPFFPFSLFLMSFLYLFIAFSYQLRSPFLFLLLPIPLFLPFPSSNVPLSRPQFTYYSSGYFTFSSPLSSPLF